MNQELEAALKRAEATNYGSVHPIIIAMSDAKLLAAEVRRLQEQTTILCDELDACNDLCSNDCGGGRVSEVLARTIVQLRADLAATEAGIARFENKERGIPQAYLAAELVQELRVAIDSARKEQT